MQDVSHFIRIQNSHHHISVQEYMLWLPVIYRQATCQDSSSVSHVILHLRLARQCVTCHSNEFLWFSQNVLWFILFHQCHCLFHWTPFCILLPFSLTYRKHTDDAKKWLLKIKKYPKLNIQNFPRNFSPWQWNEESLTPNLSFTS